MQQSWLLRYSLLIVAATREVLTYSHEAGPGTKVGSSVSGKNVPHEEYIVHEGVFPRVLRESTGRESLTSGHIKRDEPALQISQPTAMPSIRNRQDDGQIQALSAQLQSLSQSATEAISSVSSSASSAISQISRSADQATQSIRQSASQAADQANRQLSQTESSASSALSAVNARASDQISQSLASMSSRISVNLASAQSSASNAVSSARSAASQFAASKIQAFKAGASETGCDANPQAQQMESNSLSASNAAIIIAVSIIATAILSVASTCLFMRYRRKRMSSRGENTQGSKDRAYEKPVAVRGSLSPRFPRFGKGARAPADNFKLPSILPPVAQTRDIQSKASNDIGFATIAYSELEDNRGANQAANDADDTQSSTKSNTFRFQKNKGLSSATAVRLIRVSSGKSRASFSADVPETATGFLPPLPIVSTPNQPPKAVSISAPYQPVTESPSQTGNTGTQPPKEKEPAFEGQPGSVEPIRTPETQVPGWRPPIPLTATGRDRFRFRDSSELESAEPTPTKTDTMPPPNISTLSPRLPRSASLQRTNRGDFTRTMPTGQPKNGKGTFATFPRIRGEPSRVRSEPSRVSVMDRGRPNRNPRSTRLIGEDERIRREQSEAFASGGNPMSLRTRRDTFSNR